MPPRPTVSEKVTLGFLVALALLALWFTRLSYGYTSLPVYQGF